MRRDLGIILSTAGLGGLIALGIGNARITNLQNADPYVSTVAVASIMATLLGLALVILEYRTRARMRSNLNHLSANYTKGMELRSKIQNQEISWDQSKDAAIAWATDLSEWFDEELPAFHAFYMTASGNNTYPRDERLPPLADQAVAYLNDKLSTIREIMARLENRT